MNSKFIYENKQNIKRVKYENIYFFDNEFYFLTLDKNIELQEVRLLGGPEHSDCIHKNEYIFKPNIKIFDNEIEINNFLNKEIIEINGITNYFSHYYEHNIGHGLFDALYPSFLTYLNFFYKIDKINNNNYTNLINILHVPGWVCSMKCSRNWLLEIMENFSGNKNLLKNNLDKNKIYKFEILISGSGYCGYSIVNKKYITPGKEYNSLSLFRNRFYNKYNIQRKNTYERNKIIIIESERYSIEEKNILLEIKKKLNSENFNCEFINWKNYLNFKEQLELLNDAYIHISSSGTSMMNFAFLNEKSVHINLGTNNYIDYYQTKNNEERLLLMDIPISLLSNDIYIDYYNIFIYKKILYEEVYFIILKNITYYNSYLKNTNEFNVNINIPNFVKVWQDFCLSDIYNDLRDNNNINEIIMGMNNDIKNGLVSVRWIEMISLNYSPFNKKYNIISSKNLKLLELIKKKYDNMLIQINK